MNGKDMGKLMKKQSDEIARELVRQNREIRRAVRKLARL
jgi:hypothetical protein